ncbi:metallophosphoesterase [Inquilinus limosus]|uniref:metallophosphoesterase family protein n=1 Tax=Inquilinus limosus TaxID=171674 RepID=UPI003F14FBE6
MAEKEKFTVAAIGDIHVKEDSDPLREMFGEIAQAADALVLCGDLTDTGTARQAERLAEDLRACPIPVVGVLGNHDYESGQVDEVRSILTQGGLRLLDGSAVELDGVGFVGVKGFAGGFGRRMLGSFGEPETKEFVSVAIREAMRLENAMRTVKTQRAIVVLHYAPVVETIEGEPLEIYPFLGSSRLAETIDRFTVSAVVHGHAHRGVYQGQTPGGAPVYNVAWAIMKPSDRPYALIEL